MKTEIMFVDGGSESFELPASVKMTDHGVEVTERNGDDVLRVLFPWNRIERVTQQGIEATAIYTY